MKRWLLVLVPLVVLLVAGAVGVYYFWSPGKMTLNLLPSAAASTTLTLIPETKTIEKNQNLLVSVTVNSSEKVSGATVILNFDKTIFKLTSLGTNAQSKFGIKEKSSLKEANNKGQVRVVLAANKSFESGKENNMFSLQFLAKADSSASQIFFDKTSVVKNASGANVLSEESFHGGKYIVGKGSSTTGPTGPTCLDIVLAPESGDAPLTLTATIEASAGSQPIKGYVFNFEGKDETKETSSTSHTFSKAGDYTIKGRVIDKNGKKSDDCSTALTVSDKGTTHLVCQNKSCTRTDGAGTNECSTEGKSCGQSNDTRKACVDNACTVITGNGIDTCQTVGATCSARIVGTPIEGPAVYDCDNNGTINIIDFSCFGRDYGKRKDDNGDWE